MCISGHVSSWLRVTILRCIYLKCINVYVESDYTSDAPPAFSLKFLLTAFPSHINALMAKRRWLLHSCIVTNSFLFSAGLLRAFWRAVHRRCRIHAQQYLGQNTGTHECRIFVISTGLGIIVIERVKKNLSVMMRLEQILGMSGLEQRNPTAIMKSSMEQMHFD